MTDSVPGSVHRAYNACEIGGLTACIGLLISLGLGVSGGPVWPPLVAIIVLGGCLLILHYLEARYPVLEEVGDRTRTVDLDA